MSTLKDSEIDITEYLPPSISCRIERRIVECWLHPCETTTSGNTLSSCDCPAPGDRRPLTVRSAVALLQTTTAPRTPCLRSGFRWRGAGPRAAAKAHDYC